MSSIVYVIHPLERSIAYSICLEQGSGLVVSLDKTLPPGKVERISEPSQIRRDEGLTYEQVLEILLKAEKVIAL
ncbi:hypothetical protein YTPLAS72_07240 [Nitrospira sp.]|jgi:hypothetical protein|nr:hypothetical protein YTPLAS72_07240 [Nitrospira sp.]